MLNFTKNEDVNDEVDVSVKNYQFCGNPLGKAQNALSGNGRSYSAPWAVSIGFYEDNQYQHECTGSLITENIVITAAHCTFDYEEDLFIQAGVLNLRSLGSTERRVIKTFEHPDYKPPQVYFDVSIAVLEKFLSFDEKISPVCLPSETFANSDFMNRFAITIQGWGKDNNGNFGQDLTKIDLTVRKNSFCNKKYEGLSEARKQFWFPKLLISSMFCADSNLGDNIGTCYGDSGGPSMIKDEEGVSYILMGVVSGNPGECGKTGQYPDYFTFIGHQNILPWVQSTIKKASGFKEGEYPEILSLSSTSMISGVQGIYKMDSNWINNNRPVWRHITQEYKLYYDDENFWTFSMFVKQKKPTSGDIRSVEKGLVYLPSRQWKIWDEGNWILDEDLAITSGQPKYPTNVTVEIWNSTTNGSKQFEMIDEKIVNKRPVWRLKSNRTKEFLYFSGKTWLIGATIEATERESLTVYGWDYSDENTFWPNTNTLTLLHYPENITLSSTGEFSNLWFEYIGVYKKINGQIRNGRPMWKRVDDGEGLDKDPKYFNYDENYFWSFVPESLLPKFENGLVQFQNNSFNYVLTSYKQGSLHFLGSKWKFYKDNTEYGNDDDDSLIVTDEEPVYPPDVVTLSNKNSENGTQFIDLIGIYERIPQIMRNGRPVWKRKGYGDRYIYYSGKVWAIWTNIYDQYATLKTSSFGWFSFLNATWEYATAQSWIEDKSLMMSKSGPLYPGIIKIKHISKKDDNVHLNIENLVGDYKILKEKYNDKPTWKNEKLGKFVFNEKEEPREYSFKSNLESQWYVGDTIGKIDNSSNKLYGWIYSGESYIWPNYSTLYMANYPKMLTLISEGPTKELFINVVGTYEMIPGLTNMRPRWRHTLRNNYLFYAATYNWQFLSIEGGSLDGKEHSDSKILLPTNDEWELKINGRTYEDYNITITEGEIKYPGNITLNSFDGTRAQWPFLLGLFRKIPDLEKGLRPVWKHVSIDYYLFFDDYRTSWMIGPSYTKIDNRKIQSIQTVELDSNNTQWYFRKIYKGIYKWTYDETLSVIEGHPGYPHVVMIFQDEADNIFAGPYERVQDKNYNDKPYFKNGNYLVFCDQNQWFVGEKLGEANSTKVYGWVHSDKSSIWPKENILRIVNYPETLNISSAGAAQELYSDFMGLYNIVPDLIYSGRPVWKHSSNNFAYLYYFWEWGIGSTVGDLSAKIFTYYDPRFEIEIPESGWFYVNDSRATKDITLVVKPLNL